MSNKPRKCKAGEKYVKKEKNESVNERKKETKDRGEKSFVR